MDFIYVKCGNAIQIMDKLANTALYWTNNTLIMYLPITQKLEHTILEFSTYRTVRETCANAPRIVTQIIQRTV